ncbi:hypothetical protein [Micromonospora orduensis]|uniref:hypothetical protein n=1 Tax=Micromonospora orduensis TaxID=1420891 RepID=UPI00142EDDF5|nr:hypothetical protein [Micromonospora orduensis]
MFDPHRGARDLSRTRRDRSPFAFGPAMWASAPAHTVKEALEELLDDGSGIDTGRRVAEQVAAAVESARLMRPAMRMVALGLDFPTYLRFDFLVPHLTVSLNGKRIYLAPKGYAPTDEEFAFCLEFVVTAALRLAAAEAHQQDPAWLTRHRSGWVETEKVHELPASQEEGG